MAVPYYVIDSPGGGKILLLPNDAQSINDREVVMRNYAGELYVYPQVKERGRKRAPAHTPACINMTSPAV